MQAERCVCKKSEDENPVDSSNSGGSTVAVWISQLAFCWSVRKGTEHTSNGSWMELLMELLIQLAISLPL
jgi:hypothetical protein